MNLSDSIAALDTATNSVASEVSTLRSELANVATPDQLAKLDSIASRLNALASDPSNPVPAPPAPAAA